VRRVRLPVVAGSSQANKLQRRAGALRTTRKLEPKNEGEKKAPIYRGFFVAEDSPLALLTQ